MLVIIGKESGGRVGGTRTAGRIAGMVGSREADVETKSRKEKEREG
jgi:hypothetical protein